MTMFLVSLLSLYTGALFGTIFRAFGTVWTSAAIAAVLLLIVVIIAVAVWQWSTIERVAAPLGPWAALILGACVAATASYAVNRHATV